MNAKILRRAMIFVSLSILAGNSVLLYSGLRSLVDAVEWVRHSVDVKQALSDIETDLAKSQSAKRGYILTEDAFYLQIYYGASKEAMGKIDTLRNLVSDNDDQLENLTKLSAVLNQKFQEMSKAIRLQISGDRASAKELVRMDQDGGAMESFNVAIREIERIESQLLRERQDNVDVARHAAFVALAGFIVAVALLLGLLYYLASREIKQKTLASHELKVLADELHRQTEDLTRDRNEIALLNEASSFLHSCNAVAEISSAFPPFTRKLFPDWNGAVFLTAASRNRLDLLCQWGTDEAAQHFAPQQCWGLRRGQVHIHESEAAAPLCDHLGMLGGGASSLCVPLVAHGETVGLLSLWSTGSASGGVDGRRIRRMADMVARQLGLTLANIRLKESLKEQTIRDAMTNAFNRRYLEVVSQKEVAKARRFSRPLVVAMIDIDHFKRFNDTQGHPAGDAALVKVSHYLQESIRESDWLFRYGGEEFLMILTDTGPQEACDRLDMLRAGVEQIVMRHEGTTLPQVTISCGLAAFPAHADDFDGLVATADEALYRAKQEGRNCVRIALEDSVAPELGEPQPA
ncbi:diguanylate cyclase [Azospirillum sp. HJ39]|uniref:sensor domain-containing diguanylate cyclase n=1 Tax=Azospirillum sp. HJ39 TaxID=3159496 RepID=UPI003556A858